MSIPNTPGTPADTPSCYRHPGRGTHLRCTRCDRYICGDCMRDAAVGHQCVECAQSGTATVRRPRIRLGSDVAALSYALIAANRLVFAAQTVSPELWSRLVLWPPGIADGELYRLVTSVFVHNGPMHLLFNMWALYIVGPPLESHLGRLRFGALYALGALGGSALVYLLGPIDAPTAGASGAVFGLFGAVFVVARHLNLDTRWIIGLIAINLIITFVVPNISWQGHVGGLVTGTLVGAGYVHAPRAHRTLFQVTTSLVALAVIVVLIGLRTGQLAGLS